MKISVVICAAGKGSRAGFDKNKLLVKYGCMTVLEHTLSAFMRSDIDEVIVTSSKDDFDEISSIASRYNNAFTVLGSDTRSHSVKNALEKVTGDIVLIHDGARMFVTDKIITDCIDCVKQYGSGICSLPSTDTIVVAENGQIKGVPERSRLFTVQTPQGFYTEDIKKAYALAGSLSFTDDSAVYAAHIARPALFTGDPCNRKITYKSDFYATGDRVGFGIDTHAFGKPVDYVTICGVKIPSDSGLIAHSDGDVAVHALMDAMLSAAGLRDIGYYFPDTDDRYKNADSLNMLKYVVKVVKESGFKFKNASIAIQAQKPKMSKHIAEMKRVLSEILETDKNSIGISAGTNEGLGYIGEGKGITVTAAVLLRSVN